MNKTETGMLKGKPPYMSPEQLWQSEVDRRSDVFTPEWFVGTADRREAVRAGTRGRHHQCGLELHLPDIKSIGRMCRPESFRLHWGP